MRSKTQAFKTAVFGLALLVVGIEGAKAEEASTQRSTLLLGAEALYSLYNPVGEDVNYNLGARFETLYHVAELAYARAFFAYQPLEDRTVYTVAGGITYRLDTLPAYPEGRVLLGAEIESAESIGVYGVLELGLALFIRVAKQADLGIGIDHRIRFSELANDPGVFLNLFNRKARLRTVGIALRWSL